MSGPHLTTAILALLVWGFSADPVGAQTVGSGTAEPEFTYPESEEAPLSGVEGIVADEGGTIYVLDRHHPSVLVFAPDGKLVRTIAREGRGPGELRTPWRIGLLGDTLWVIDVGNDRISLFTRDGAHLEDLGPFASSRADGRRVQPLALLPRGRILAAERVAGVREATVLALHEVGGGRVGALDTLDHPRRTVQVTLPVPGGGALNFRNPYAFGEMVAPPSHGERVYVVGMSLPETDGSARYAVTEWRGTEGARPRRCEVAYVPERLDRSELERWASGLSMVEEMTELGVFPSAEAAREAILDAMDPPTHRPPVVNAGRGVLERGLLVESEGDLWVHRNLAGEADRWDRVRCPHGRVATVDVPAGIQVLAVGDDTMWGVRRSELDVPVIVRLRVRTDDPVGS